MNKLSQIAPLVLDGVEVTVFDNVVRFVGVISMRSPSETVTPFLKQIHLAVIGTGLKALTVDFDEAPVHELLVDSRAGRLGGVDPNRARE